MQDPRTTSQRLTCPRGGGLHRLAGHARHRDLPDFGLGRASGCVPAVRRQSALLLLPESRLPQVPSTAPAKWISERQARVLPTHHFHVVFTVPDLLKPLAQQNRERFFRLLFEAAASTLLTLGGDPKRLGGQPVNQQVTRSSAPRHRRVRGFRRREPRLPGTVTRFQELLRRGPVLRILLPDSSPGSFAAAPRRLLMCLCTTFSSAATSLSVKRLK
jgi:hypothetical protein